MLFPLYDLNPHRRVPWLTLAIIAANFGVFLWSSSLGQEGMQEVALRYGFIPGRLSELGDDKPFLAPKLDINPQTGEIQKVGEVKLSTRADDVYLTFLTAMFLHGGWMHIIMNMWMLWIFGNNIEDRLGHLLYVGYYLVGGILATLCHWVVEPGSDIPVVGASGAVATVLGGYALTYPTAKVRTLVFFFLITIIDIPALVLLGIWFALQLASGIVQLGGGIAVQPVAFWAHIGGFVAGMVLMPLLALGTAPPGSDWNKESDDMFRFDDPRSIDRR